MIQLLLDPQNNLTFYTKDQNNNNIKSVNVDKVITTDESMSGYITISKVFVGAFKSRILIMFNFVF